MINMKAKTAKKAAIIGLFAIIAIIASGGLYLNSLLNKTQKVDIPTDDNSLGIKVEAAEKDKKDISTIALFGIDAKNGNRGRSDAIMLLTIDNENNKIKLASIMRDSYVNIPDRGMDKINHAYSYGGPELALKTINSNYGLNIRDYATVDFTTLPNIIDQLGGVYIDVKSYEVNYIPGVKAAGLQTLNGEKALAYSRIRYSGNGDYERTERQRTVLNSLFNKMATLSITEVPKYLSNMLPFIETSLSNSEILSLATNTFTINNFNLTQARFPEDDLSHGETINGVWYLRFDIEETAKHLQSFIYEQ
ncbi:LCP family protein [Alloiococcus sp. CFN-8]|uniref:LCP family protein n=1 Tax=Alloiococcus sp. CFN-8 TaxID=3416081 RepID=UPI003CF9BADE